VIATLHDTGLLRGLSPAEAVEFASRFQQRLVDRKELVFAEAAPADALYAVLDGKLKLSRRAPDGRQAALAVPGPGEVVGELSVLDGGPRLASACALVPSRLARISGAELRAWVRTHPQTAEALLQLLAREVRRATDAATSVAWNDVAGRLAGRLLELGTRFGRPEQGHARVSHGLSQDELGQLVGATRETVNKTLSEFTRRGWIRVDGRSVILLQPARLARRAGLPARAGLSAGTGRPAGGYALAG